MALATVLCHQQRLLVSVCHSVDEICISSVVAIAQSMFFRLNCICL